jgi:hypothetical protein
MVSSSLNLITINIMVCATVIMDKANEIKQKAYCGGENKLAKLVRH